jgi:AMP-polyphosphate phosphotransferase
MEKHSLAKGDAPSKSEYDEQLDRLLPKILNAHFAMRESKTPLIILISGVEGAGKGKVIHALNEWLDPRGTETHSFWVSTEDERRRPAYWRYVQALPAHGRVAILFGSWYTDPIIQRVSGAASKPEFAAKLKEISRFEEMLATDGAVFLKLWFHISKKTLKKRLKEVEKHPELHWMVLPGRKAIVRSYNAFVKTSTEAMIATDSPMAPWHVIGAEDERFRDLKVAHLLYEHLKVASIPAIKRPLRSLKRKMPSIPIVVRKLAQVDLEKTVEDQTYEELLPRWQHRLLRLSWKMFRRRRSLLAVFEGWDAAGKGGTIRRVTQALDPRLYQVVGFAAPTAEEKAHHYLWRFWKHLPVSGLTTIFDRSHYGRVLVERVEGFARPDEWGRAYDEINAVEKQLCEGGFAVQKFWLHISAEEQLKRFNDRERVARKNYKITAEDWRNRDKWTQYENAVEEMLMRTSTEAAPWHVVPANNKRYARLMVLKTLCHALEESLES